MADGTRTPNNLLEAVTYFSDLDRATPYVVSQRRRVSQRL